MNAFRALLARIVIFVIGRFRKPPQPSIFHIVRAHVRKTGQKVKFHFRGLREFIWAGYRVSITVPGRDHFIATDFDVGAIDEYWADKKAKYLDAPEIGRLLVARMKDGLGRYHGAVR